MRRLSGEARAAAVETLREAERRIAAMAVRTYPIFGRSEGLDDACRTIAAFRRELLALEDEDA